MTKKNVVIELDNNYKMNVEQTLTRAQREPLDRVIVIGLTPNKHITLMSSKMTDMEAYWALNRAAQVIFDG